jgi:hypothetical protein
MAMVMVPVDSQRCQVDIGRMTAPNVFASGEVLISGPPLFTSALIGKMEHGTGICKAATTVWFAICLIIVMVFQSGASKTINTV